MNKTGAFFIGFGAGAVFMLVVLAVGGAVLGFVAYRSVSASKVQAMQAANETGLEANLTVVRNALDLYQAEHQDRYPCQQATVGTDGAKFIQQLTSRTDLNGKMHEAHSDAPFGPYLRQMPANSFARDDGSVKIGKAPCPRDGTSDWYFCTESSKFSANDAKHKDP